MAEEEGETYAEVKEKAEESRPLPLEPTDSATVAPTQEPSAGPVTNRTEEESHSKEPKKKRKIYEKIVCPGCGKGPYTANYLRHGHKCGPRETRKDAKPFPTPPTPEDRPQEEEPSRVPPTEKKAPKQEKPPPRTLNMDIEDATNLFRQMRETSRAQKHERWRESMF